MSGLVTLYSHLGDVSAAVEVLDDAVEHAQKNKVSKSEIDLQIHSLYTVHADVRLDVRLHTHTDVRLYT